MSQLPINELCSKLSRSFISYQTKHPTRRGGSELHREVIGNLSTLIPSLQRFESDEVKAYALELLQSDCLQTEIQIVNSEFGSSKTKSELHVLSVLRWFKKTLFTWVDKPPCEHCGSHATISSATVSPNREESKWDCSRVEVYICLDCQKSTRFPRYNNPRKVLETRKGRCGEYTTGFIALANAMGYDSRYIHDFSDHVWAEVYVPELKRWVHADPSEGVLDSPLIYATGWGKPPCIIIASSKRYGIADVTARYSPNYSDALMARRKKGINGFEIYNAILTYNALFARPLSLNEFQERRDKELAELAEFILTPRVSENCSGRTSGSYEWRKSRGELGASKSKIDFSSHQLKAVFSSKSLESNQIHSKLALNGCCELLNSSSEKHRFRLTPNSSDKVGSVFLKSPVNLSKGFRIYFRFMIGKGNGADGFALVFQASGSNAVGEGGCGLGYSGIKNSVALEFDTYKSEDRCADPDDNHLSLQVGKLREDKTFGNVSSHHSHSMTWTASKHLPPFQSGNWYGVMVSYLSDTLQVEFDDSSESDSSNAADGNKMSVVLNCPDFNLVNLTNNHSELYVGFTAATGGLHQEHWVEDIKIETLE